MKNFILSVTFGITGGITAGTVSCLIAGVRNNHIAGVIDGVYAIMFCYMIYVLLKMRKQN